MNLENYLQQNKKTPARETSAALKNWLLKMHIQDSYLPEDIKTILKENPTWYTEENVEVLNKSIANQYKYTANKKLLPPKNFTTFEKDFSKGISLNLKEGKSFCVSTFPAYIKDKMEKEDILLEYLLKKNEIINPSTIAHYVAIEVDANNSYFACNEISTVCNPHSYEETEEITDLTKPKETDIELNTLQKKQFDQFISTTKETSLEM